MRKKGGLRVAFLFLGRLIPLLTQLLVAVIEAVIFGTIACSAPSTLDDVASNEFFLTKSVDA
jgi:hypothetical protein